MQSKSNGIVLLALMFQSMPVAFFRLSDYFILRYKHIINNYKVSNM